MITIPGYEVIDLLPQKYNNLIYRAVRNSDGLDCVIKASTVPEDVNFYDDCGKLFYEIQLLQRLNHSNIVKVFDFGTTDKIVYYAMEYCTGGDIKNKIQSGDFFDIGIILKETLHALNYMHEKGILHLDLNPANIGLREDDSVCLFDFGISHEVNSPILRSKPGSVIGTCPYLAPELIRFPQKADLRTDIYSLGCIIYEMLTTKRLFEGSDLKSVLRMKMVARQLDLSAVPSPYDSLVDLCVAYDPNMRFDNCSQIIDWLIEFKVIDDDHPLF